MLFLRRPKEQKRAATSHHLSHDESLLESMFVYRSRAGHVFFVSHLLHFTRPIVSIHQNHLQKSERHNRLEPFPARHHYCRVRCSRGSGRRRPFAFHNVPAGPSRDQTHRNGLGSRQLFVVKPENAHGNRTHPLTRIEERMRKGRNKANGDHGRRVEEQMPHEHAAPVQQWFVETRLDCALVFRGDAVQP